MSTDIIKRCPFCGRRAELRHNDDGFSYIVCANDGCYVRTDGHLNDEAAIKAWNTRKPMGWVLERLQDELELSGEEKARTIKENPLQFNRVVGYSNGIAVAIDIVREEGVVDV